MVKTQRKLAFTLAEVLITLGIIGVVAAMTIPTLMQKTNQKETISRVKKNFSIISNAVGLAIAENGTIDKWDLDRTTSTTAATSAANILKPYLKVIKDCEIYEEGCFYNGMYTNLNGSNRLNWISPSYNAAKNNYKLLLNDGSAIMFSVSEDTMGNGLGLKFVIDINGVKGPNRMGIDLFQLISTKDGKIIPYNNLSNEVYLCQKNQAGDNCSSYILENDNMNYLDE